MTILSADEAQSGTTTLAGSVSIPASPLARQYSNLDGDKTMYEYHYTLKPI